jgi:hypothetical protein
MERVSLTDRAQNHFILPRFLYKASKLGGDFRRRELRP